MFSIFGLLICAIISESFIHGYVYMISGDTLWPLPGAAILIENTTYGDMTDYNGEYSIEIEPGEYTVKFSMMGMLPIHKEIELFNSDSIEVSFKTTQGTLGYGAIVMSNTMGAGAYIFDDNGYPLSNLRVSLPCYGLSDTTNWSGSFYLGPFDAETRLYIYLYDGAVDSSYTLHPRNSQGRIISLSESGRHKIYEDDALRIRHKLKRMQFIFVKQID